MSRVVRTFGLERVAQNVDGVAGLDVFTPLFSSRIPAAVCLGDRGGSADFVVEGDVKWRIVFTLDADDEFAAVTLWELSSGSHYRIANVSTPESPDLVRCVRNLRRDLHIARQNS